MRLTMSKTRSTRKTRARTRETKTQMHHVLFNGPIQMKRSLKTKRTTQAAQETRSLTRRCAPQLKQLHFTHYTAQTALRKG